jgi:hypothetical protein
MADLEIPLLDPDAKVLCQDCNWTGAWREARLRIMDFPALIAIADRIPAGQCPQCSKLVFLAKQDKVGDHGLSYAARALFPHFCNLQSGLSKMMADGQLSAENMGEDWLWFKSALERLEMEEHEVLVSELERILDSD